MRTQNRDSNRFALVARFAAAVLAVAATSCANDSPRASSAVDAPAADANVESAAPVASAAPVVATVVATPKVAAETQTSDDEGSDDWNAVYLAGGKVGWMHHKSAKAQENGRTVWITTSEESFSLARLKVAMTITQQSVIVEDEQGAVLRFSSASQQGPTSMKTEGTVEDGKIKLVKNGGAPKEVAYPQGALGPEAMERKQMAAGMKPGTSLSLVSFVTDAPDKVVTITSSVGEQEKKDVLGRVLFLYRIESKDSLFKIPTVAWADGKGHAFMSKTTIPGLGEMTTYETTESVAKKDIQPAEVFAQSEIEPDHAIENPRALKKAVYRISKKDGPLASVYEGDGQALIAKNDGKIDLAVDVWTPPADFRAAQRPFAPAGMESYTAANAYLETGDELVKKFAAEAVGDEKDAVKCARLIETYVRKKITKKDFNVGFATAAETAKSCEGDCSEHGVLCAALARAVGLPSRVCTGIVYLSPKELGKDAKKNPRGIFGFHMWTEVLVAENQWMPIDAAIGVFDATHVAFGKSDLSSASTEVEMGLALMDVMGSIRIEVLEPK